MYIPFEQITDSSPIWIYQATEPLNEAQLKAVMEHTHAFLVDWTSHGRPLQAGALMQYDRFLIVGIQKPNHDLSCCTTDSAIHLLRSIKSNLQIDLLKRDQITFKKDDHIFAVPLTQVKHKLEKGEITADTLMFDHAITHKGDLANKWLVPVKDSWLVR